MIFGFWLSLGLWAVVGLITGLAVVLIVPWVIAKPLGDDLQDRVAQWYLWAAQTMIGRAGVIVRDEEFSLVRKTYDEGYSADKDTTGDQTRRHYDALNVLGRLRNRIFGFGLADHDLWVSPLAAEIGAKAWQLKQNGELGRELRQTDGEMHATFKDGIPIPSSSQLVDLTAARHLVQGSSRPETSEDAEEIAKTSQEPFTQTVSPVQALLIVGGLIGGFVVGAFMSGDGGGGAAPPVPNTTTISMLPLLGLISPRAKKILAVLVAIPLAVAAPATAWWAYGPVVAIGVIAVETALVVGIPTLVWLRGGGSRDDPDGDELEETATDQTDAEAGADAPSGLSRSQQAMMTGAVLASTLVTPAIAWATYGPVFAVITWLLAVVTVAAIPIGIWLIGSGLPGLIAVPIAKISWILAMLTVGGRGIIVERDDRTLEFRKLRDNDDGDARFWARLSDGKRLPVDGEAGDLRRFAWGQLGVAAEKSARNMDHLCINDEELVQARADGGTRLQSRSARGGYIPVINTGSAGDWVVALPHLESWTRGAAQAQSVQQGRNRGLTDYGGEQGLGQLTLIVLLIAAPTVGLLIGVFAA